MIAPDETYPNHGTNDGRTAERGIPGARRWLMLPMVLGITYLVGATVLMCALAANMVPPIALTWLTPVGLAWWAGATWVYKRRIPGFLAESNGVPMPTPEFHNGIARALGIPGSGWAVIAPLVLSGIYILASVVGLVDMATGSWYPAEVRVLTVLNGAWTALAFMASREAVGAILTGTAQGHARAYSS